MVDNLSDEFGQYNLILNCEGCGHERRATLHTFAKLCGWEARLDTVAKRMRWSKCGERRSTARALQLTTPRGYKSH
jgi:hypothetical protein